MLAAFPTPYPDELLYSIVARYGRRFQFPNRKSLVYAFFGTRNAVAVTDLPTRLSTLAAAVPGKFGLSADDLIDDHTLLPYYAPFLPSVRLRQVRKAMRDSGDVHLRAGIAASLIRSPDWLRYCPVCAAEDIATYGERYWHRAHQVPGVEVCSRHRAWLENSQAKVFLRRERHRFVAADEVIPPDAPVRMMSDEKDRVLLALSEDSSWLLSHSPSASPEKISEKYRYLLAEIGLARYSGRVRAQDLLTQFTAAYPPDVLTRLHLTLDGAQPWLLDLVRPSQRKAHHPLRHLLLIHFLRRSAETFFSFSIPPPFGHGPWPCLNLVCPNYRAPCIKTISVAYTGDRGEPIGTLECPHCSFTYSRTGRDTKPGDFYRRDKVVSFGSVWTKALAELRDASISLREKARRLGVDPGTVRLRVAQLVHEATYEVDKVISDSPTPKLRDEHRLAWKRMTDAQPDLTKTELRKQLPATYMWLYRNDRLWLDNHSPTRPNSKEPKMKVDWKQFDANLAAAVPAVGAEMKADFVGKPRRVTVTAMARTLKQLHNVQKNPDKLPKTVAALRQVAETREAFAIRRIQYVTHLFDSERRFPKTWQLVRRAGVRKELLESSEVQVALRRAIDKLRPKGVVEVDGG